MSLLPGVPSVNPGPVAPSVKPPPASKGNLTHIAGLAHSAGKPARSQELGSVVGKQGAGLSSIAGGSSGPTGAHSVGQFAKEPAAGAVGAALVGGPAAGGVKPLSEKHPGLGLIKGAAGGVRSHVREGGLGPGKMSTPGPSDSNFSQQPEDSE